MDFYKDMRGEEYWIGGNHGKDHLRWDYHEESYCHHVVA